MALPINEAGIGTLKNKLAQFQGKRLSYLNAGNIGTWEAALQTFETKLDLRYQQNGNLGTLWTEMIAALDSV